MGDGLTEQKQCQDVGAGPSPWYWFEKPVLFMAVNSKYKLPCSDMAS